MWLPPDINTCHRYTDPEASFICLEKFTSSTMVGWDLTLANGLEFGWCESEWFAGDSLAARFVAAISASTMAKCKASVKWANNG
jgi:hypothetical protein